MHLSRPTFCGGDAAEIMYSDWNIPICWRLLRSKKRKPRNIINMNTCVDLNVFYSDSQLADCLQVGFYMKQTQT